MLGCSSREECEKQQTSPVKSLWCWSLEERGHTCHWGWVRSGSFWKSSETGRVEGPSCAGLLLQGRRMTQLACTWWYPIHTQYSMQSNVVYEHYTWRQHNTHKDVSKDPHPLLPGHRPDVQTRPLIPPSVNTNKWQTHSRVGVNSCQVLWGNAVFQAPHGETALSVKHPRQASWHFFPPSPQIPSKKEWVMVGGLGIEMMLTFWLRWLGKNYEHHPRDKCITICYVLTSIF